MSKKRTTANLKIVDTQTKEETQQQEGEAKSDKITRSEIVERVRKIRQQFEMVRDVHHASMFNDADINNDLRTEKVHFIHDLAEWLNPQFAGNLVDNLSTVYHIGLFAGVIFTATSPAEIDRAERGLIFISSRPWLIKE